MMGYYYILRDQNISMKNIKGRPVVLSNSSLKLMDECPRCFWLQLMNCTRRPFGMFPSLPSGMDIVIKKHFDHFREKGEMPPELKDKIDAELFPDAEKLKVWRNNRKGVHYTDPESGITLLGAVDDMLVHNGKLIVLDFKTRGFPLKEDTHNMYQTQLDIYSWLFMKNNEKIEDYGYLLFYHPNCFKKDGSFAFHTDIVKVKTNPDNAEKIFKKAIKILKGKIPKADEECPYCNVLNDV